VTVRNVVLDIAALVSPPIQRNVSPSTSNPPRQYVNPRRLNEKNIMKRRLRNGSYSQKQEEV